MSRWSSRIDSMVERVRADVPCLKVEASPLTPERRARVLSLQRIAEPTETIELIESADELILLFGVNLRLELSLTDDLLAQKSLEEAEQLLRAIILDGYEECTWSRKGGVVRTEAVLSYGEGEHRFSTSTLTGHLGGEKKMIKHEAWDC